MEEDYPSTNRSGESQPVGDERPQDRESGERRPLPLPYDVPLARPEDRGGVQSSRGALPPASGVYPKVPEDRWVKQDESILQKQYAYITGQHPVPRPQTRPLKPPKRFQPVAHWQSITMLSIVLVLAVIACLGLLALGVGGASLLHPRTAPTATPSRIASPTSTSQ
jgi:hypothetical protein